MSNGTTTDLTSMLGKPITSGSYKTLRAIREGNGSTIKNLTSLGSAFSRVTDTKSSLGNFATSTFTGN
ncbi:hypothetical protein ACSC1U_04820 [Mammaliicoccus lentus]